ncbi:MAG TPA: SdrD B-like domain-containing protein [Tepidisphaeraceae bacterium]|nr:SdrD B-like domain-containing protein [Tepidisphaeraceae bacterium]
MSQHSLSNRGPRAVVGRHEGAQLIEPLEPRTLFTVLLFQPATGAFADYQPLPQTYGDRVTAATQNGFKYGTAGGTTPKVLASYGTSTGTIETWPTAYGDLPAVAFAAPSGQKFEMKLTADSGFNVTLASFDMASFASADYTINSVSVVDSSGKTLFSKSNVKIFGGTAPHHTHFAFTTPLKGQGLTIRFDPSNQGGWNVGIDNVQFSQVALQTTTITGNVFADTNANGKKDTGEAALSGWRVYIDTNNNGMYDSGEQFVLSDSTGKYSFTFSTPGTYIVSVQLKRGYYQTSPHALIYTVKAPSANVTNALFGVKTIAPV